MSVSQSSLELGGPDTEPGVDVVIFLFPRTPTSSILALGTMPEQLGLRKKYESDNPVFLSLGGCDVLS